MAAIAVDPGDHHVSQSFAHQLHVFDHQPQVVEGGGQLGRCPSNGAKSRNHESGTRNVCPLRASEHQN